MAGGVRSRCEQNYRSVTKLPDWVYLGGVVCILFLYSTLFEYQLATVVGGDAKAIVRLTLLTVEKEDLWFHQDPPLRYLIPSILYLIFRPIGVSVETTISYYSLYSAWIVAPLVLWWFAKTISTRRTAYLSLAAYIAIGLSGLKLAGHSTIMWQYDMTLPSLLAALGYAHKTIEMGAWRRPAVITGVFIGLTGTHQIALAVTGAAIITLAFLAHRDLERLVTIGGVGGCFALLYFWNKWGALKHIWRYAGKTATRPAITLANPSSITMAAGLLALGGLMLRRGTPDSDILLYSVIVTGVIWAVSMVLNLWYFDIVSMYLGLYFVAIAVIDLWPRDMFQSALS